MQFSRDAPGIPCQVITDTDKHSWCMLFENRCIGRPTEGTKRIRWRRRGGAD